MKQLESDSSQKNTTITPCKTLDNVVDFFNQLAKIESKEAESRLQQLPHDEAMPEMFDLIREDFASFNSIWSKADNSTRDLFYDYFITHTLSCEIMLNRSVFENIIEATENRKLKVKVITYGFLSSCGAFGNMYNYEQAADIDYLKYVLNQCEKNDVAPKAIIKDKICIFKFSLMSYLYRKLWNELWNCLRETNLDEKREIFKDAIRYLVYQGATHPNTYKYDTLSVIFNDEDDEGYEKLKLLQDKALELNLDKELFGLLEFEGYTEDISKYYDLSCTLFYNIDAMVLISNEVKAKNTKLNPSIYHHGIFYNLVINGKCEAAFNLLNALSETEKIFALNQKCELLYEIDSTNTEELTNILINIDKFYQHLIFETESKASDLVTSRIFHAEFRNTIDNHERMIKNKETKDMGFYFFSLYYNRCLSVYDYMGIESTYSFSLIERLKNNYHDIYNSFILSLFSDTILFNADNFSIWTAQIGYCEYDLDKKRQLSTLIKSYCQRILHSMNYIKLCNDEFRKTSQGIKMLKDYCQFARGAIGENQSRLNKVIGWLIEFENTTFNTCDIWESLPYLFPFKGNSHISPQHNIPDIKKACNEYLLAQKKSAEGNDTQALMRNYSDNFLFFIRLAIRVKDKALIQKLIQHLDQSTVMDFGKIKSLLELADENHELKDTIIDAYKESLNRIDYRNTTDDTVTFFEKLFQIRPDFMPHLCLQLPNISHGAQAQTTYVYAAYNLLTNDTFRQTEDGYSLFIQICQNSIDELKEDACIQNIISWANEFNTNRDINCTTMWGALRSFLPAEYLKVSPLSTNEDIKKAFENIKKESDGVFGDKETGQPTQKRKHDNTEGISPYNAHLFSQQEQKPAKHDNGSSSSSSKKQKTDSKNSNALTSNDYSC
jgi:hypothetical protein